MPFWIAAPYDNQRSVRGDFEVNHGYHYSISCRICQYCVPSHESVRFTTTTRRMKGDFSKTTGREQLAQRMRHTAG